jgi:uncharacterized protein
VDISFDPAKNARNIEVHGIALSRATDFDWYRALIWQDTRRDYGEQRFLALATIDSRVCVVVYTPRGGRLHVISLRKANRREVRHYESQAKTQDSAQGS